uniref:Uncharacterized protein n=1 Tax=Micrurus spixii TaxID=129469 RepID=A0A2D4M8K3_9SAUR
MKVLDSQFFYTPRYNTVRNWTNAPKIPFREYVHSFTGKEKKKKMQATRRDPFAEPRRAELLLLHACLQDKVCVIHRQRVSFSVEHPVLEGEHVIFREQKIEIL